MFVVGPTTPPMPKHRWFGLLPVRSPLLRESRLISVRRATEMFQFTRCPPSLPMCSAGGLQTSLWRGCPIRILKDQRLYAAPLERFAGLRVLLRSHAPRHPPCTLCSLFSILLAKDSHPSLHVVFALLCFTLVCISLNKIEVRYILFSCSGAGQGDPNR